MNKRYYTVLNWFREYGFTIVKEIPFYDEVIVKDTKGKNHTYEIHNNNIWRMKNGRTSYGKTKTELYYNLDKIYKKGSVIN